MREIKFRGWHVQNQRMFSAEEMAVDQLTMLTTGSFINVHGVHTHLSTIYDRDKFIPMQFTGLKDKNDHEIYEGDILKCHSGYLWTVSWNDNHACFQVSNEKTVVEVIDNNNMEISGNIYQTPKP